MLALSRKKNEAIVINNDIEITVLEVKGDQVKIGITAPKEVPIYRKEVYLQIQEANKLGIPVIGIVDTNHSPDGVDYVVPGNDDSSKAVAIYARGIADAVLAGRADSQTEIVEAAADEEFVEVAAEAEEQPAA